LERRKGKRGSRSKKFGTSGTAKGREFQRGKKNGNVDHRKGWGGGGGGGVGWGGGGWEGGGAGGGEGFGGVMKKSVQQVRPGRSVLVESSQRVSAGWALTG